MIASITVTYYLTLEDGRDLAAALQEALEGRTP